MPVQCVVGTQWGDEGKGKILDRMAAEADLVVRYQGGANAGHTVVVDGEKFAFQLLPSGVLHAGKRVVLANGMVVDPVQLLHEIDEFGARGRSLDGRLFLSNAAHVVFPYHKALDQASERRAPDGQRIGTTGRGIGPTYADKARRTGMRVGDLYDEARFETRLRANVEETNRVLTRLMDGEPLDADAIVDEARAHAERLRPYVTDTFHLLHDAIEAGERVFLEGAQGLLLDVDFGTYPYVTSSNSCALGIPAGTGIPPGRVDEVIGVTKAYCTRVGEGPFPTEQDNDIGASLRKAGAEFGTVTGRPRRCGWLDGVALKFAARLNGLTGLALTKLDTLSGLETVRIATHYEIDGTRCDRYPVGDVRFDRAKPHYESLPGWSEDLTGARHLDDLPATARRYIERVAEVAGVPIRLVSVGPDREQTILP